MFIKKNRTNFLKVKSELESRFNFEVGEQPYYSHSNQFNQITSFNNGLAKLVCNVIQVLSNKSVVDKLKNIYQFPDETNFHEFCKSFSFQDIICRSDFCFENGEIKLIEINSGSSIGGWELDFFHNELFPLYDFDKSNLEYKSIIASFFEYAANTIFKLFEKKLKGNILFIVEGENSGLEEILNHFYKSSSKYISGSVFCINPSEVPDKANKGKITLKDLEIDALFNLSYQGNITDKTLNNVWKNGNLIYSENIILKFIGSKGFLALVHDPIITEMLSETEVRWIKNHIPFTFSLADKNTATNQKQNLLAMKNDLVIKKSYSLQGEHVFIGKDIKACDWEALLQKLNVSKEWVSQKFCTPNTEYISSPDGKIRRSLIIWSAFNFGGNFGGLFTRSLPIDKSSHLVNAAKGAFLNIVYKNERHIKCEISKLNY